MTQWLRSWTTPAPRRPIRSKPVYRRPYLEQLEDRIVPTYVNIGGSATGGSGTPLLTLNGDFSGGSTLTATSSSQQLIQIGLYTANPANDFKPVLEIEAGGQLSFSTQNNEDGSFTITAGTIDSAVGGSLHLPSLATQYNGSVNASDLVNGSFSFAPPLTVPAGPFTLTINSVGIRPDTTHNNTPSLAVEGALDIALPGGNDGDKISVSVNGGDFLYINSAAKYGFDLSGATVEVKDQFTFLGLTIAPDLSLDLEDSSEDPSGTFEVWGTATVSSKAEGSDSPIAINVAANFGSSSSTAGFTFTDGQLQKFQIGLNGSFQLGGLTVSAKDLNVSYDGTDLAIGGSVSLALEGYTFTAGLQGTGGGAGLVIDHETGAVTFDGLKLGISNFNLGAFSISNASIAFQDQGSDLTLSTSVTVSFPGFAVSGFIKFSDDNDVFVLEKLGFQYQVTTGEGIPVGDTDVFITYLFGELDGLGTQNWSVSGAVGVAFGQPIPTGSTSVRLVQALGGFTLDKDELVLDGSVAFLGSMSTSGTPQLTSLIGILDGNVTLDWGKQTYSASVNGSFLDGIYTLEGEFQYVPGEIYFQATAAIGVPQYFPDGKKIPLIGGKQLASANFVLDLTYTVGDLGAGFGGFIAGWLHVPVLGDVGLEYDVTTKDLEFIGKKGIEAVEHSTPQPPPQYNYSYQTTYNVPARATSFDFLVQWVNTGGGDYKITVETPDESTITDHRGYVTGSDSQIHSFADIGNYFTAPPGQVITGLRADNGSAALPSGTYTFTLSTVDNIDESTIVWTTTAGYAAPAAPNSPTFSPPAPGGSTLTVELNGATLDSGFLNQANATLFVDTRNQGYQGVQVGLPIPGSQFQGSAGTYNISFTVDLATLALPPGNYYFYVVLNDGFNAASNTSYSGQFAAQPQLTGTVKDTGDGRSLELAGWTIFIDLNKNGLYDAPVFNSDGTVKSPGEPIDVTDADGQYDFYNAAASSLSLGVTFNQGDSYAVGAVLPPTGYQFPTGSQPTTTFTYNGGTSTIDLSAWQETTIAGTVFKDLNGNGQPDPGEGVAGVTVYLDSDNDGFYDLNESATASLSSGAYQFVGLSATTPYTVRYQLPADYQAATGGPTSYAVTVGGDGYGRADNKNFSVVEEATISGTVTNAGASNPGPLSGWTVYLDLNDNGKLDSGEPSTTSDLNGHYEFSGLQPGTYHMKQVVQSGWEQVSPFTSHPSLSPAFQAWETVDFVATADFNNDGNLDVAYYVDIAGQLHNLYYRLGDGKGNFGSPLSTNFDYTAVPVVTDIQATDLNDDGYVDIVALLPNGAVLMEGGLNGFTWKSTIYTPFLESTSTIYGMAAVDLPGTWDTNGTGGFAVYGIAKVDILGTTSPYYSYFVDVITRRADGTYQIMRGLVGPNSPSDRVALGNGSLSPLSGNALAIGDLNNDGNLDLFMNFGLVTFLDISGVLPKLTQETETAWIAYGHGDGTFGQEQDAYYYELYQGVYQSKNSGFSCFFPDLSISVPGVFGPMTLADLNGDLILDAVTSNYDISNPSQPATEQLYVLQQTSVATWYGLDGQFASTSSPSLSTNTGHYVFVPAIGLTDINGDGKPDITLAENPYDGGEGQILTYFNQGSSSTGIAQFNSDTGSYLFSNLATGARPVSMALGDYNNDGWVDYVLGDNDYDSGAQNLGGVWLVTNTSENADVAPPISAQDNGSYTVHFENQQTSKQVYGQVFDDRDGDGQRDPGEPARPGVIVYLDHNGNGTLDPGEPFTTTNAAGLYAFSGLTPNQSTRVRVHSGHRPDEHPGPADGYGLTLGQPDNNFDFALRRRLLQPVPAATVPAGATFSVAVPLATGLSTRGASRPSRLVYTLAEGAPAGAAIDPATGVLTWTPPATGQYTLTVRVHDAYNPLTSDTTTVTVTVLDGPPPPPFVVTADAVRKAGRSVVQVYNADGSLRFTLKPFGKRYRGRVRVAVGDVTGDGVADVIVSAGRGGPNVVKVYDGLTGAETINFRPYGRRPNRGISVAVADVLKTKPAQIVTGLGPDGGRVRLFDGRTGKVLAPLF